MSNANGAPEGGSHAQVPFPRRLRVLGSMFGIPTLVCGIAITLAVASISVTDAAASDSDSDGDGEGGEPVTITSKTEGMERHDGYFPFYWDSETGKVWLEIPEFEREFLYIVFLETGLGSNPVGLDRGQLDTERLVYFRRVGPKVLLEQPNLRFRAVTDNPLERRAVQESFAMSTLWGSEIVAEEGGRVLVDASSLFLRDAHGVIRSLDVSGQGSFSLDSDRSSYYLERTQAFPKNTEVTVSLTFTSNQPGRLVRETSPTPGAITLRQRHSLVQLPDDGYEPRVFDPRSGCFHITYADYATAIDVPLEKRFITRHRLEKEKPNQAASDPVEPIVYYLDPGAPEPVRSALLDGARWWESAFAAAGFTNAFRVQMLPDDADPLDLRYNVIQWVHRSTRGWSYGASVVDPRTGEILKGHVSLGSLRVRQDRLLFEGFDPRFGGRNHACMISTDSPIDEQLAASDPELNTVDLALARIRQLAAHEVGHTLGFAHNFAASTYGRASVMDYPAPLAKVTDAGKLDLSEAYGVGIGEWDKFTTRYAYSQFPEGEDEHLGLQSLIDQAISKQMLFLSDSDARASGAGHPLANLWDNGDEPVSALEELMRVRKIALDNFGEGNLLPGQPMALLEETLVPLYLQHRFQVSATAKMLGGAYYTYAIRGDGQVPLGQVPAQRQRDALRALLETLDPSVLRFPDEAIHRLPPHPYGYWDDRERFPRRTAMYFDPLAAARVSADMTTRALFQRERAARMVLQKSLESTQFGYGEMIDSVFDHTWYAKTSGNGYSAAIAREVERSVLDAMTDLAGDADAASDVRGLTRAKLSELAGHLEKEKGRDEITRAHRAQAVEELRRFLGRSYPNAEYPSSVDAPPGSPIGSFEQPAGAR